MSDNEFYFQTHIFCCSNQRPPGHERGCCADKGAERLRNFMKRRAKELGILDMRVNNAGCLDRCEDGPVIVIYPEGVWYRPLNEADMEEILTRHVLGGEKVERLLLSTHRLPQ